MESTVVSLARLREKSKWVYSAHSQIAQKIEQSIAKSPFGVRHLGDLTLEIADGLHGVRRYVEDGVVMLAVGNVTEHGLDLADKKMVAFEEHERLQRSQVQSGDLLITITGRLGTTLIYDSDEPANLSAHVARAQVDPDAINPEYLAAYFNSSLGRQQVEEFSIGSLYPHINVNRLRSVRVIVPPRPMQDRIAQVMRDAHAARKDKLGHADQALSGIDDYVFSQLGMAPRRVKEDTRFTTSIARIRGGRFDVAFNMGFHKFDPYPELTAPLGSMMEFPRESYDPSKFPQRQIRYIDIGTVDPLIGEVREPSLIVGANAPSRARQVVHTDDVIVSTVRPTRGAIALIPRELDGSICSTGFTIVRAGQGILPEYLFVALRLHTTLEQFGRRSAGSSYPAILESDIVETLAPRPDLEVQRDIVTEVNKRRFTARRLRAEAEQTVAKAKALVEQMILGEEPME